MRTSLLFQQYNFELTNEKTRQEWLCTTIQLCIYWFVKPKPMASNYESSFGYLLDQWQWRKTWRCRVRNSGRKSSRARIRQAERCSPWSRDDVRTCQQAIRMRAQQSKPEMVSIDETKIYQKEWIIVFLTSYLKRQLNCLITRINVIHPYYIILTQEF